MPAPPPKGSSIAPPPWDGQKPGLVSVRRETLMQTNRSALKALLSAKYLGPNGRPLWNYSDALGALTNHMVNAIIEYETAKGWLVENYPNLPKVAA